MLMIIAMIRLNFKAGFPLHTANCPLTSLPTPRTLPLPQRSAEELGSVERAISEATASLHR